MEQIFFILLVAIVGAVRLLMQVAEKKKNAEAEKRSAATTPNAAPAPGPTQTEEERVRKFFEALGVPTTVTPPPRVPPRKVTSRKARQRPLIDPFPVPRSSGLPPLSVPTASATPSVEIPPPIVRKSVPEVARQEPVPAKFEVRDIGELAEIVLQPRAPSASTSQTVVARLLTGEGLREAIILREILGAPRSLQPFSHVDAR